MVSSPRFRLVAAVLLALLCTASPAKPPFLKVFLATYKIDPESRLGKTRCLICHQPPAPPIRNPYGKEVQMALLLAQARMVTPDILKSVEQQNTGDGVPNIVKIEKDLPPALPMPKAPLPKPQAPTGTPNTGSSKHRREIQHRRASKHHASSPHKTTKKAKPKSKAKPSAKHKRKLAAALGSAGLGLLLFSALPCLLLATAACVRRSG